jgi:hypothetical protein
MYNYYLQNSKIDIDSFVNLYIYSYMDMVLYVLEAVVGFIMISILLGILGVFSTHVLDLYSCRGMVHLSWYLMGLTYIGVLISSYFFIPVGNMGY